MILNIFSCGHVWLWELDCEESWGLKNWCFWTVVLGKTLESPLDSKDIKPVNPKGNRAEYSLEALMLKLNLQYIGHRMRRDDSLEKTWERCWGRLKAGGEGDDRGQDGWMASLTQWTWVWASSRRWWRTRKPSSCSPWGRKESDMAEWLNNK